MKKLLLLSVLLQITALFLLLSAADSFAKDKSSNRSVITEDDQSVIGPDTDSSTSTRTRTRTFPGLDNLDPGTGGDKNSKWDKLT